MLALLVLLLLQEELVLLSDGQSARGLFRRIQVRGRVAGVGRPLSPSYLAHILGHLMAALGYLLLGLHGAM